MNRRRGYVIIQCRFYKDNEAAGRRLRRRIYSGSATKREHNKKQIIPLPVNYASMVWLTNTLRKPPTTTTKLAEESEIVFMFILIDGYNLIRQSETLRRYERRSLEEGRRALITKLVAYEKERAHKITVVFDGGESGWADEGRDREGKIDIIYSRHGERADDVIKRIAAHTMEETIVVSSDREISSYITRLGKTPLSSLEFETIMNQVTSLSLGDNFRADKKNNINERQLKKKGPARRLPKAERLTQTKIKKL